MSADHATSHILQSLFVNLAISVGKLIAAIVSGSGSMLAETLHSFADCGNQLLLLLGVKRARRPADADHPLGYGAALYFWSFLVSLLLFSGGGLFSLYEGVHKLHEPEPVGDIRLAMAILVGSLLLEGWSLASNVRELNARRGTTPFFRYLKQTKDSDLIVVFGENAAAVLGLGIAAAALLTAAATGDGRWDAIGSLGIGVVLVVVAVFLAVEIKSLLVGERADPEVEIAAQAIAELDPDIVEILTILTVQKGPGEVLVACKVRLRDGLDTAGVVAAINRFEQALHDRRPEVRWSFVEPDIEA
jgi:cation diffusion facilitator family transporter